MLPDNDTLLTPLTIYVLKPSICRLWVSGYITGSAYRYGGNICQDRHGTQEFRDMANCI
jgi:hypothetical protein